jgi:hypothetical protein
MFVFYIFNLVFEFAKNILVFIHDLQKNANELYNRH